MAPRSEDPKLIIRVTNLELVQPICSAYVNVTDGQTDRQTDGRTTYDSNTALALRASRGKNTYLLIILSLDKQLADTQSYQYIGFLACFL